jgi:N-hydroxyarylamine O-acetyltransferase
VETADLDRYLARIGYGGPREPTLAVLHGLTAAHTKSVPFENLDVLLSRKIELGYAALFDKLVVQRRGGYCFEQNGLFLEVLGSLGFEVTPLSARVRLERPRDFIPPRTHMFLRVMLDGEPWLTDVGVGSSSLTAAIRIALDVEQPTPHDTRRIVRQGDMYFHQVRHGESWADVYEFTGETMPLIDRVVGNWYTSAHPDSGFKSRLTVARAAEDGQRYIILDEELKIRERDGRATVQKIESAEQLLELLARHFGLRFDPGTRFGWPR